MDSTYRESLWKRASHKNVARALRKAREEILRIPDIVETSEGGGHPLHHAVFLYGANSLLALVEASLANELDHKRLRLEEVTKEYLSNAEEIWQDHVEFIGQTIGVAREEAMSEVTVPLYEVFNVVEAMSLCAYLNQNGVKGTFKRDGEKRIIKVKPEESKNAVIALYEWLDSEQSHEELLRSVVTRRLGNGLGNDAQS